MNAGEQIERIYLANNIYGRASEEIRRIAEQHQIPVNKVPIEKINSFNVENHEGCVALRGKIKYQDLQQVISFVVESGEVPLFLILNGIKVFASEMTAEKKIFDLNFSEPCAIIMGSEDKGIFPALMKICDEQFSIPMKNDFESLNVSVAAGMILYEAMKQRM